MVPMVLGLVQLTLLLQAERCADDFFVNSWRLSSCLEESALSNRSGNCASASRRFGLRVDTSKKAHCLHSYIPTAVGRLTIPGSPCEGPDSRRCTALHHAAFNGSAEA